MNIDMYTCWSGEYTWNGMKDQSRARYFLSKGQARRMDCDMWIHHMDVPKVFYPQSSTGFSAILTNSYSGLGDMYCIVLGNQLVDPFSEILPFRAKVKPLHTKRWYGLTIGFTGDRLMWECNYRQAKEELLLR